VTRYKVDLQPNLLLALHYVGESRADQVAPDRLHALRDAGFVSLTDTGWRLTAAGVRRVKPVSARLRAELAELKQP